MYCIVIIHVCSYMCVCVSLSIYSFIHPIISGRPGIRHRGISRKRHSLFLKGLRV